MIKAHESFIRGKPFKIGKTSIFLPTLDEIYEKELDLYFEYLYSLIMDFDKMRGSIETKENTYYTDYDLFIVLLLSDESFLKTALEALEYFTKDRFIFTETAIGSIRRKTSDGELHYASEQVDGELVLYDVLTPDLWLKIREVLSLAHWVSVPEERGPLTGKAAEIADKLRRNKEEVARLKAKKNEGQPSTEIYELIASVCAHSTQYNLFNIWELSYYQFFDQFKRLQLDEEYEFSLKQILAGVDPKKLKLLHWTSSILTPN